MGAISARTRWPSHLKNTKFLAPGKIMQLLSASLTYSLVFARICLCIFMCLPVWIYRMALISSCLPTVKSIFPLTCFIQTLHLTAFNLTQLRDWPKSAVSHTQICSYLSNPPEDLWHVHFDIQTLNEPYANTSNGTAFKPYADVSCGKATYDCFQHR